MPDGRHMIIAVEESDSTVGFYDSFNGDDIGRVAVGRWPHEIEVSADGSMAYVTNFGIKDYDENIGTPGESISVIDLRTLCEVDRLFTFRGKAELAGLRAPHGVKLTPDGSQLYVNVEVGNKMLIFDLANETKKDPIVAFDMSPDAMATDAPLERVAFDSPPDDMFGVPEKTHNFIFSADGNHLFIASGSAGLSKMRAGTGKIEATLVRERSAIRGVSYTPDKRHLIVSGSNELCLVDPGSLKVVREFKGLGVRQLLYSQPTPDGKYVIAPAVWEGQLLLIDAERGRVARRLVIGSDPIHVAITPSGETAYVSHGRSRYLSVIDIKQFREVRRIQTHGGPNGIALAPLPVLSRKRTIKLGACIPLSGVSTSEGQDLRLGYQFWQETVNAAGGLGIGGERFDVEVVFRDSRSETSEGLLRLLTEELIDEEKVEFVFGGYPSPPNLHSGRVAEERKIPFITASGAMVEIYDPKQGFEFVFGIMTSAASFLVPLFEYLAKSEAITPKPSSALFISCNDPAAIKDAKTTAKQVSDAGLRVIVPPGTGLPDDESVLQYPHLQNASPEALQDLKDSYRKVLTRAVGHDLPDLLVHTGHLPEAVALVQVASEMNYTTKGFAFSVGPALPEFAIFLGKLSEYLLGAAMWTAEQVEAGHDRFVTPKGFARAFFDRFSKRASYLTAGAVACGTVLEDAIRRAKTKEPTAVKDALRSTKLSTFYSKVEFNAQGLNENRPLVMIQLKPGDGEMIHVPLWPRDLVVGNEAEWPFPGWQKKEDEAAKKERSK